LEKCFLLKVDFSQCIDDFMTVHKINTEDVDLPHLLNSSKYTFDRSDVYARANLLHLPKFDYIANDLRIPVLSPKFIGSTEISNCEDFELVPMILVDDTFTGDFFDGKGNLKEEVKKIEGYYTLNFIEQREFCDIDKSTFRKLRSQPDSLGRIKKIVLRQPKEGFPKIFKIKETVSSIFISESMKNLLEENCIKGCLFEEVEVSSLIDDQLA
jgi:hypothetical protein